MFGLYLSYSKHGKYENLNMKRYRAEEIKSKKQNNASTGWFMTLRVPFPTRVSLTGIYKET